MQRLDKDAGLGLFIAVTGKAMGMFGYQDLPKKIFKFCSVYIINTIFNYLFISHTLYHKKNVIVIISNNLLSLLGFG